MKFLIAVTLFAFVTGCNQYDGVAVPDAVLRTDLSKDKSSNLEEGGQTGKDKDLAEPAPSKPIDLPDIDTPTAPVPEIPVTNPEPEVPVQPEPEPPVVVAPKVSLYCFKDRVDGLKAYVYCAIQVPETKKYFEPQDRYVATTWSATLPSTLKATIVTLGVAHRYNALFTLTATTSDALNASLNGTKFHFEGEDVNKNVEKAERTGLDARAEQLFQSQKPQNNQGLRCLDRDRMKAAQPKQVVTTPCNSNALAHEWYITADSKIAHAAGECLKFDAYDSLSVVGDCATGDTPKFDFNGEQIKIRGTNLCLGLKSPDNSGVDYSASVTCNTSDAQQRWKISAGSKL